MQVFHNRLDLKHITPEHIEAAHRVGVKRAGSTRPILVKFLSRKTMQQVIQKRRKLKHTEPKVVIVEDLTKSNYNLFLCASDHPGASRAWTSSGKVFVQDTDSKIHKIEKLTCNDFPVTLPPSPPPPLPEPLQPNNATTGSR